MSTRPEPSHPRAPARLPRGEFFGTKVWSCERSGLVLSETRYAPDLGVPTHVHAPGYFCLLVEGSYWEQYGRRRVTYHSRSVVFHPPEETHRGKMGHAGGRCFNVELSDEWLDRLRMHAPLPGDAVDRHTGELVWLALRLYRAFRQTDTATALTLEGLVLEMLGAIAREQTSPDSRLPVWLRQADARLHDEYARSLTAAEVARDLGIGPVRLARAFRRHLGESMGSRLQRIRVERACHLLTETARSLVDVALTTGFADQSHFTRVFKRRTGMTPGQFRQVRDA